MGNDLLLLLLLLASLSYLILINILISKCFALFRSPVEKKKRQIRMQRPLSVFNDGSMYGAETSLGSIGGERTNSLWVCLSVT